MDNFYLLYGQDNSIIENELKKIIEKLNIKDQVKYTIDNTKIEDILEDASTISMFADKKVIIIENCDFFSTGKTLESIELLEKYLTNYNKDTYIIFITTKEKIDTRKKIYKLLNKEGKIIECQKKDKNYINNYIKEYIEENNYKLESIDYFINKVGTNLDNAKNELDKLFMYKIETKTIKNEDIDKIAIKNIEEEIFSLTDAIIAKDTKKSLDLLENFLNKNYDEIAILMLLASQFRFLLQVKLLLNQNKNYDEIAKILEANPYRIKFTIKKLYNYTKEDLTQKIKKIATLDHDIKLGLIDKKTAVELLILNI